MWGIKAESNRRVEPHGDLKAVARLNFWTDWEIALRSQIQKATMALLAFLHLSDNTDPELFNSFFVGDLDPNAFCEPTTWTLEKS